MLALAEDAAEAVMSVDVQLGEVTRVGDRFGSRRQVRTQRSMIEFIRVSGRR
jgi:hypothetical protein